MKVYMWRLQKALVILLAVLIFVAPSSAISAFAADSHTEQTEPVTQPGQSEQPQQQEQTDSRQDKEQQGKSGSQQEQNRQEIRQPDLSKLRPVEKEREILSPDSDHRLPENNENNDNPGKKDSNNDERTGNKNNPGNRDNSDRNSYRDKDDIKDELLQREIPTRHSGYGIISVELPSSFDFIIDPRDYFGFGQVFSDEYIIRNNGNTPIYISINDFDILFPNEGDFTALDAPFDASSKDKSKSIYLEMNFSVAGEKPISIKGAGQDDYPSIYLNASGEDDSYCTVTITGSVNPKPLVKWQNGDVEISLSYRIEAFDDYLYDAPPEADEYYDEEDEDEDVEDEDNENGQTGDEKLSDYIREYIDNLLNDQPEDLDPEQLEQLLNLTYILDLLLGVSQPCEDSGSGELIFGAAELPALIYMLDTALKMLDMTEADIDEDQLSEIASLLIDAYMLRLESENEDEDTENINLPEFILEQLREYDPELLPDDEAEYDFDSLIDYDNDWLSELLSELIEELMLIFESDSDNDDDRDDTDNSTDNGTDDDTDADTEDDTDNNTDVSDDANQKTEQEQNSNTDDDSGSESEVNTGETPGTDDNDSEHRIKDKEVRSGKDVENNERGGGRK